MFSMKTYNHLKNEYKKEREKGENGNTKLAVEIIQKYLDDCGLKMPKPLYRYTEEDITTHKYLEGVSSYSHKIKDFKYMEVLNPQFAY